MWHPYPSFLFLPFKFNKVLSFVKEEFFNNKNEKAPWKSRGLRD
jgi:hypothetical protein